MRAVVFVPGAPLLLEGLGGRSDPGAPVRSLAVDLLSRTLTENRPASVAVLATGTEARDWTGTAFVPDRLTGAARVRGAATLPTALGVGDRLLAAAGWTGPVTALTAGPATTGATGADDPKADLWVVVGDGSALRRAGGPGRPDPRAAVVDETVRAAVAAGDPGPLTALDPALADELMITGAPAWRRIAELVGRSRPTGGGPIRAEVAYADDPFGVFMIIARWLC